MTTRQMLPFAGAVGLVLATWGYLVWAAEPAPVKAFSAAEIEFFEKEVQPLLQANCLSCHGGEEKIKGGLRLTSRADVLKGGDSGPAVSLEQADASRLLKAVS